MFPLLSAACEKTLGKKINRLLFFTNQGEIRASGDAEAEPADADQAEENDE